MSNEILQGAAQDLLEADSSIANAEELISAMKEAGEDVSELEANLRSVKMRKTKWERMLKARGITAAVPE